MSSNQEDTLAVNLLKIFRERYWEVFRFTDNKRVKSLYYLLIVSFIFMLSLISGSEKITVLGFNVNQTIAPIVIPFIVWLFSLRYQFLSALSLNNFAKFNQIYEDEKARLEKSIGKESLKGIDFKPDDLNEIPNMYRQVFIKINKSKIKEIGKFIEGLATLGANLIYYLINFISIIVFVFTAIQLGLKEISLIVYSIILIFITILPHIYFFKKTTQVRNYLSK